jgi:hypothetical protein
MSESVSKPLQHFPGTNRRVTRVYAHLRSDTYPVETEADGYVGERSLYSEPTVSVMFDASGIPTELAKRLMAVVREIEAVTTP